MVEYECPAAEQGIGRHAHNPRATTGPPPNARAVVWFHHIAAIPNPTARAVMKESTSRVEEERKSELNKVVILLIFCSLS